MNKLSKNLLIVLFLVSAFTVTVRAYESNIALSIIDSDYPETVESGGVLELEVTVSYDFTQPATINVWVYDGPWYSHSTRIVADVYVDVSEPSPKTISLEVPVPDEAGEYIFQADAGWCELGSTELLSELGTYQEYNITFTVTPMDTVDTSSDTTTDDPEPDSTEGTTDENEKTGGIPGFPTVSVGFGLIIAITLIMVQTRKTHPTGRLV